MKKTYLAAPGLTSVSGVCVAEDGTVQLGTRAALYELAHGHVSELPENEAPAVVPEPRRRRSRRAE